MAKIEIDIGEKQPGLYFLEVNGERVLLSDKLGEIMDRVEKEVKKNFNIKNSRFGGFLRK